MPTYQRAVDVTGTSDLRPEVYESQFRTPSTIEEEQGYSLPTFLGLQKTTARQDRAAKYRTITKKYFTEAEIDYDQEIKSLTEKILGIITFLKTEKVDSADTAAALASIMEYTNELWKLRSSREQAFAEVLVLLKSCLKYYDLPDLSPEQKEALGKIYTGLSSSQLSSFSKDCRKQLTHAGFNIFRPLIAARSKIARLKLKV